MKASTSASPASDRATMTAARKLFEEEVRRHYRVVYAFARSRLGVEAAEDVTQETFLRAFRQGQRRGGKVLPWLLGIARNCIREEVRRARRAARRPPPSPEKTETEELPRSVRRAIERLPHRSRLILTLKYFDGRSCREIADELGLSVGAVKVALCRAYGSIREEVGHELP